MKKRFFWLVGVVAVFILLLGTVEIGMADTVPFDYTGAPFIGYAGLGTQQFLDTNITGNITLDLPAGWQNSQFSYLNNSEISSFSLVAGPDGITSANGSIQYAGFAFSQGQIVGWNLRVKFTQRRLHKDGRRERWFCVRRLVYVTSIHVCGSLVR